jgi:hypothetical protein
LLHNFDNIIEKGEDTVFLSSVIVATGLMGWTTEELVSILDREEIFSSSIEPPDRLWTPHSLLYRWYRKLFPWGEAAGM